MRQLVVIFIGLFLMGCISDAHKDSHDNTMQAEDMYLKIWGTYLTCKKDSDCMIANNVCGGPTAINRKKRHKFSERVERVGKGIECATFPDAYDRSELSTICDVGYCSLEGYKDQLPSL